MGIPVQDKPLLQDGEYKVVEVKELNFFDLTGDKAKTKGTSCKAYHAEINVSTKDNRAQIYTIWGPTGAHQNRDWRYFDSEFDAKKEFDRIIKSKLKKGYVEIDVAQRAIGSDSAKAIVKPVVLTNMSAVAGSVPISKLDTNVQRLIQRLFGATQSFVATTLKCPLGQLTNNQIDEGRKRLDAAKLIVNAVGTNLGKKDQTKLQDLTNEFYALIPHNLGSGARGVMTELLLDDLQKIINKEADLDTLLDAKAIGAVLASSSLIDDQYNSLSCDLSWVDPKDNLFKWINDMVQKTKASNHSFLGKITVLNAWKINRNKECDKFISYAESIKNECGKQVVPSVLISLVGSREDVEGKYVDLYKKANILPLFHGTRTPNITSISKQGLLIRPSNAAFTGAMYGSGIYKGLSTKAINYTNIKASYWAKGNDDTAFLFIVDACLGNQKIATGAYSYTLNNIKPHHSVWAKGGYSGVINDEFIVYTTNQSRLRYLIEFTCQAN